MTLDTRTSAILVAVIAAALAFAFFIGRCTTPPSPHPVDDLGIDAGPGERAIAARLDAAAQRAEEELAEIEREHAADIAAFDDAQRAKYDALRHEGPEAVSDFLADFNRRVRGSR